MLVDVTSGTKILSYDWAAVYLALPIFGCSGLNPWVYGYRNGEVRAAMQRVLEEALARLGLAPARYGCPELLVATPHELNSFASNVRLCAVSPNKTTLLLLPTAPGCASSEVSQVTSATAHLDPKDSP